MRSRWIPLSLPLAAFMRDRFRWARHVAIAAAICVTATGLHAAQPALGEDHPSLVGSWEELPFDSRVVSIHAALLNTGKVLFAAGSQNDPNGLFSPKTSSFLPAHEQTRKIRAVVWDPSQEANGFTEVENGPWDFFCSGHAFLPDGRLLLAGGTGRWGTQNPPNEHAWTAPGR